ncbi:MAG: efflux RND transporter periplasmic adaptor subunit [Nevskia sp.]|nr:efflux RND transporter periplasmic adaptor subunit [Nevskia sp.]
MPIHDHTPSARGRASLWVGIGLGLLFVAAMFTHGFGLFNRHGATAEAPSMLVHQGDKIVVPEGSPLRQRLTVAPAPAEQVGGSLVIPGVVESDPARTAAVLTPLSGRVLELKVALGDRVAKGQVLALLDSPDLAQAYDDDDKAADTFRLTARNLERAEGQSKIGAGSDKDLDQARSDHAQAEAEYGRTQARLKTIGAPLQAPKGSRQLLVRAPVSGSITSLAVAAGNMINDPTQPMMTIADLSTVWVTALVPEKDLASVSRNQDADVSLTAYPDRSLHGKVLFVSDVVEPDSHRNKLRIAFANADYALKPNMFASVTLLGARQSRVVLPTSALLMNNDRTSVFVATAPWTFERRTVDPQLEEGASVAIRSGVSAGEQVVMKGGVLLND